MTPYSNLPARQFWKTGVQPFTSSTIEEIYTPKWPIEGLRIATAGSCFAQEIARALREKKHNVLDVEPPPSGVNPKLANRFGYGLYSARHGNIYTSRHLIQLTQEAVGQVHIAPQLYVWQRDGRYYDAFRPTVEPSGLPSSEEVVAQRHDHLNRFKSLLSQCDLFIFTLGLTEAWFHRATGLVYQTAPGVAAGDFSSEEHEFRSLGFAEILGDMLAFRDIAKSINSEMRFLLTVSPVPLTATAEPRHVLVSTVRSKSVLRSVAGELAESFDDVDYFPSFELLSTPFLGPSLFEANKRSVQRIGVEAVMRSFFDAHEGVIVSAQTDVAEVKTSEEVVCEDALLEAFAPR
ncbi:GSCFA domain-containing protein [Sinorhizobium meliloti]|uniref:GSCFA domain-containing protein n=1 Tax=Rhizobium meliloti TaxID=382 RepID=UPI0002861C8B|nr:GSCFA domain-containing protein [Sinorhizobium meliloti]ASP81577.1 hypothetical protein CDO27_27360 [Sinorhizobium meliloti]MDE3760399.1 GSCFA domain-containing protein [Sinorhizobium meliloti]MQV10361.1 hypothetical protein [Sinorhizobium meliloti]MQW16657.1 hypothetical protein [Sinorhizobium meliloti]RVK26708.1 hypothetical protein CN161_30280 [Sinorhizobium meliloti]